MYKKKIEKIEEATDIYLTGNLCISDIPKWRIYKLANGKEYVKIILKRDDEPNNFNGYITTHTLVAPEDDSKHEPFIISRLTEWIGDRNRIKKNRTLYSLSRKGRIKAKKEKEEAKEKLKNKIYESKDDIIDKLPF